MHETNFKTNKGLKLTNSEFQERDAVLKLFGFASYADYLKSDLWAWIREALMKLPESRFCRCCKTTTGLTWHHESYSLPVLIGNFSNRELFGSVVRLCNECHRAGHFFVDGEFIESLCEVNARLKTLAGAFEEDPSERLINLHAEIDRHHRETLQKENLP